MKQEQLDFTRAEQLGILRRLPSVLDTDSGEVSKRSIHAVLRAVDEFANSGTGWCWASTETIASQAIVSERTVRRAMRWLDDAGFVTSKLRGNGQTKMTKIVWSNLAELVEVPVPSGPQPDRPVATSDRPVVTPDRPVATSDRPVLAAISGEHPVQDSVEHPVAVRQEKMDWVLVDVEAARALAKKIREASKCGSSTISTELIWEAAIFSAGTDWDALAVAKSIGKGNARIPRSYLRGAIEKAKLERPGVQVAIKELAMEAGQ